MFEREQAQNSCCHPWSRLIFDHDTYHIIIRRCWDAHAHVSLSLSLSYTQFMVHAQMHTHNQKAATYQTDYPVQYVFCDYSEQLTAHQTSLIPNVGNKQKQNTDLILVAPWRQMSWEKVQADGNQEGYYDGHAGFKLGCLWSDDFHWCNAKVLPLQLNHWLMRCS